MTGLVPFGSAGLVDAVVTGASSSTAAITSNVTSPVSVDPSAYVTVSEAVCDPAVA